MFILINNSNNNKNRSRKNGQTACPLLQGDTAVTMPKPEVRACVWRVPGCRAKPLDMLAVVLVFCISREPGGRCPDHLWPQGHSGFSASPSKTDKTLIPCAHILHRDSRSRIFETLPGFICYVHRRGSKILL